MNNKPDYVPSPAHTANKLRKLESWREPTVGAPADRPIAAPRPNNDKRDFISGDEIKQRSEVIKAQIEKIRAEPTVRRQRFDEAKARAKEWLKDKAKMETLKPAERDQVKAVAEGEYPPELVAKDEADKAQRIKLLTSASQR